ncbi:hypothetical protein BN130_2607 [Cronobacter malonaticus 507]|nr:hypothetical protein BN130_2607 [Cronobacter malonaticus 507]
MQRIADPLQTVNEHGYRTRVENRLQRTADVNGEQKHQIHHAKKDGQAQKTVENDVIQRGREAVRLGGEAVTDGVANRRNALIAGVNDVQRRVVKLAFKLRLDLREPCGGVARNAAAVDIAFEQLQPEPAALPGGEVAGHRCRQGFCRLRKRRRIMDVLHIFVTLVTINGEFQTADSTRACRHQRHHRAAKAGRQRVNINADILLFSDIQHIERDHARNAKLQQLQRQVEIALKVGGVHHVYQHVRLTAKDVVAGDLFIERGLRGDSGERVGARQIDQRHLMTGRREAAFLTLDRYACPVAHALPRAGELVKQRGFAGVGIAD